MKTNLNQIDRTTSTNRIAVGTLALAVCLGVPSFVAARGHASQDQAAQSQAQDQQRQAGDASAPAQSSDPTAEGTRPPDAQPSAPSSGWHYNPAPQDAANQDAGPQGSAPQDAAPQGAPPPPAANAPAPPAARPDGTAPQAPSAQVAPPQGPLPQVLTVPAGTTIPVRLREWLSSDQNHAGDRFSAELDGPIVIDGWVVARRGQTVVGRVALAQKANHGNNESKLGVELAEITLVDGQQLTVSTELQQDSKTRSAGHDAATVGATTAIGAIIGAAIGGGQGAAIGAGAGVAAGLGTIMVTSGRPTVLHPEQLMMFRLQSPVDIDTARGHVAFRPVTQADYGRDQQADANRPQLRRYPPGGPYPYGPYGPPPPYYYGYCQPGPWACYYRR